MIISSSLVRTTGFPIANSFEASSSFTITVSNGPAYLTVETVRNSNGFYDGAPSFKLVSSSNASSQVFGDYIVSSYIGSVESGSLTFTALNDIPSNNLLIKMATPLNPLDTDSGGLIGDLELGLQLRGGIFENQVGTQVILQELENIS